MQLHVPNPLLNVSVVRAAELLVIIMAVKMDSLNVFDQIFKTFSQSTAPKRHPMKSIKTNLAKMAQLKTL